jgi:hypothetical protein
MKRLIFLCLPLILLAGCSPQQPNTALETLQMKQAIDQNSVAIQQIWANPVLAQAEKVELTGKIVLGLGEKAGVITAEEAADWQAFKNLLADNAILIGNLIMGQANPASISLLLAIGLMLLKDRKQ